MDATTTQEWISRTEACELIGCSEQTLRRLERKHGLESRTGERGRLMLRVADLVRHGRLDNALLADHPTASSAATAAPTAAREPRQGSIGRHGHAT